MLLQSRPAPSPISALAAALVKAGLPADRAPWINKVDVDCMFVAKVDIVRPGPRGLFSDIILERYSLNLK